MNDGSIWGYAVCVIIVAFFGKFLASGLAAKLTGFNYREAAAVGSLMACKGLVELIVLNIGLDAGILNQPIFAMFVLMGAFMPVGFISRLALFCVLSALVTTFATSPLVLLFYPSSYRESLLRHRESTKEEPLRGRPSSQLTSQSEEGQPPTEVALRRRFTVVFSRLAHLPSLMAVTKLLHKPLLYFSDEKLDDNAHVHLDALRLLELTDRTSTVQRAANIAETSAQDPLQNIYTAFASLNGFVVSPEMAVVSSDDFANTVVSHAQAKRSEMIILPWGAARSTIETFAEPTSTSSHSGPFEGLFKAPLPVNDSPLHATFVRSVMSTATSDVALFVDRRLFGASPAVSGGRQHIFLAFQGGPDDRLALSLLVQLCHHPGITGTCVFIRRSEARHQDARMQFPPAAVHRARNDGLAPPAPVPTPFREVQLQHESLDQELWQHYFSDGSKTLHAPSLREALSRLAHYELKGVSAPLEASVDELQAVANTHGTGLMIMAGRSSGVRSGLGGELERLLQSSPRHQPAGASSTAIDDFRQTVGELGCALMLFSLSCSLLTVQSSASAASQADRKGKRRASASAA